MCIEPREKLTQKMERSFSKIGVLIFANRVRGKERYGIQVESRTINRIGYILQFLVHIDSDTLKIRLYPVLFIVRCGALSYSSSNYNITGHIQTHDNTQ